MEYIVKTVVRYEDLEELQIWCKSCHINVHNNTNEKNKCRCKKMFGKGEFTVVHDQFVTVDDERR